MEKEFSMASSSPHSVQKRSKHLNKARHLLSNFKDSEQSNTTQHRYTQLRYRVGQRESQLDDGTDHDETVETVEQGDEVTLEVNINVVNKYQKVNIWTKCLVGS